MRREEGLSPACAMLNVFSPRELAPLPHELNSKGAALALASAQGQQLLLAQFGRDLKAVALGQFVSE